jgi:hypothetical protein
VPHNVRFMHWSLTLSHFKSVNSAWPNMDYHYSNNQHLNFKVSMDSHTHTDDSGLHTRLVGLSYVAAISGTAERSLMDRPFHISL